MRGLHVLRCHSSSHQTASYFLHNRKNDRRTCFLQHPLHTFACHKSVSIRHQNSRKVWELFDSLEFPLVCQWQNVRTWILGFLISRVALMQFTIGAYVVCNRWGASSQTNKSFPCDMHATLIKPHQLDSIQCVSRPVTFPKVLLQELFVCPSLTKTQLAKELVAFFHDGCNPRGPSLCGFRVDCSKRGSVASPHMHIELVWDFTKGHRLTDAQ